MRQRASFFFQILVALSFMALSGVDVAFAQGKAVGPKIETPKKGEPVRVQQVDNESLTATEVTFQPGDISSSRARPGRLIHYLTSGEFLLTFPDGKTESRKFKAGETNWRNAETAEVKNTGKKPVRLLQVVAKSK